MPSIAFRGCDVDDMGNDISKKSLQSMKIVFMIGPMSPVRIPLSPAKMYHGDQNVKKSLQSMKIVFIIGSVMVPGPNPL